MSIFYWDISWLVRVEVYGKPSLENYFIWNQRVHSCFSKISISNKVKSQNPNFKLQEFQNPILPFTPPLFVMTGVPESKYFQPLASRNFPINICIVVDETLVYKYTTLVGRARNGWLHDFKFAETSSIFRKILYMCYSHGKSYLGGANWPGSLRSYYTAHPFWNELCLFTHFWSK